MSPTISEIRVSTGYQVQFTKPANRPSSESTQKNASSQSSREDTDTVNISSRVRELEQAYQSKETDLEQNHNSEKQELERKYLQAKNDLEREFEQKKQTLGINTYA